MTSNSMLSERAATCPEQTQLAEYFAGKYPDSEVWLMDFKDSTSGFSNETRFFTLNVRRAAVTTHSALAARWAPMRENRQFHRYDIAFQYHAMQALAQNGVPVPKMILLEEDPGVIGGPFFVMTRVAGTGISDYPPGAHGAGYWFDASEPERAKIWWRALEIMAKVNRIDWRKPEFAFIDNPVDGVDAIRKRLVFMRQQASAASKTPVDLFERAIEWLTSHIPGAPKIALCWSDPRPGNIVWQNHDVAAACDWESMNVAPPENDLAWFILVDEVAHNTHGQPRLTGLPTTAETIARYEQLLGRKVDSFHYYLVFQSALLAILMALSINVAIAKGIRMPADYATNNYATHRLKQLLGQAT